MSATSTKCTHYWIIDHRDVGTCRYCGEVRDFAAIRRKWEQKLGFNPAAVCQEGGRASGEKRRRSKLKI